MSYKVKRTTYNLKFVDPDHDGIVVKVWAMSMAERLHVPTLVPSQEDDAESSVAKLDELHDTFIGHVVEWNLADEDDTPIPVTVEGLRSLEPEFIGLLIGTWRYAKAVVNAPLDEGSTSGEPTSGDEQVEATLLGIPSESLAS